MTDDETHQIKMTLLAILFFLIGCFTAVVFGKRFIK